MARGVKKTDTIGRDWGRQPYISKDFYAMMNTPTNMAIWTQRLERHSMFEKPYMKDHNYFQMQRLHPSMFKIPYRRPEPDSNPLGNGVDLCKGTVHATLDGVTAPFHYVGCGTSHVIGMDGGVPPFEVGGVAGSLNGSVSGDVYTAPSCGECRDEVTDHIQVVDACGRVPNLIIKTRFSKNKVWILDRAEVEPCGLRSVPLDFGYCDEIIGDVLVRAYYRLCASNSGPCNAVCTPPHCDCPIFTTAPCVTVESCSFANCWWALYMTEYFRQECI